MTITTTATDIGFSGDGSTTVFAVPFPFFSADDLSVVSVTSTTATTLTRGTHYSVAGGNGATGTVTMTTAPASGTTLKIMRQTTATQAVAYASAGPFPAATHEAGLDRAMMAAQESAAAAARAVRGPRYEAALSTLPPAAARAGLLAGYDSNGQPTTYPVASAGSDGTYTATGTGATSRTYLAKLRDTVNAADYGAVAGQDIGPALQRAHDAGAARIVVNAGSYTWGTAVTFTTAVEIIGAGFTEGPSPDAGTWFTRSSAAIVPLTLSGTGARGSRITRCAFYDTQPSDAPGWAPTDYPAWVKVLSCLGGAEFDDVFFANATRGIYADNSGRVWVRKLRGHFYKNAVEIDRAYDTTWLDGLHLWPFSSNADRLIQYAQANADAVILRRADSVFLGGMFAYGFRSAVSIQASVTGSGTTTKFAAGTINADFCKHGVWVGPSTSGASGIISRLETQHEAWPSTGSGISGGRAVLVDATATGLRLNISEMHTERNRTSVVDMAGVDNRLFLGNWRADYANQDNVSAPLIACTTSGGTVSEVRIVGQQIGGLGNAAPLRSDSTNVAIYVQPFSVYPTGATASPLLSYGTGTAGLASAGPTNADLTLDAQGTGSVRLRANGGKTLFRADDNAGTAAASALLRPDANNVNLLVESGNTNAGALIVPKGTGAAGLADGNGVVRAYAGTGQGITFVPLASAAPGTIGEVVMQATSNTALAFKLKGSDGTVRTATLTLA